MSRRVYIYFTLTTVLGVVLGAVATYYGLWYSGRIHREGGFNRTRAVEHLKKVLNLSDAQALQLDQIFDESEQKTKELQKQIEPQFQAIHMETRARIRQILNPAQQKVFDEHLREIDERRKRRPQSPPPAPR